MTAPGTVMMAKKQRTIQLPEDVYRVSDGLESRSGVRFNRQLLAALLQYYFSNPRGPDHRWMEAAVAVENGDISIGQVPTWVAQRGIDEASAEIKQIDEDRCTGVFDEEGRKEWYERLTVEGDRFNEWYSVAELADDPIDALLTFWKRLAAGIPDFELLHSIDPAKHAKRPHEPLDK